MPARALIEGQPLTPDLVASKMIELFNSGASAVAVQTNMGAPLTIVEVWMEGGTIRVGVEPTATQ